MSFLLIFLHVTEASLIILLVMFTSIDEAQMLASTLEKR
jgi:hypothetical protein